MKKLCMSKKQFKELVIKILKSIYSLTGKKLYFEDVWKYRLGLLVKKADWIEITDLNWDEYDHWKDVEWEEDSEWVSLSL